MYTYARHCPECNQLHVCGVTNNAPYIKKIGDLETLLRVRKDYIKVQNTRIQRLREYIARIKQVVNETWQTEPTDSSEGLDR